MPKDSINRCNPPWAFLNIYSLTHTNLVLVNDELHTLLNHSRKSGALRHGAKSKMALQATGAHIGTREPLKQREKEPQKLRDFVSQWWEDLCKM